MTFSELLAINQDQKETILLLEGYYAYEAAIVFTGENEFRLRNESGDEFYIEKRSIFLLRKNDAIDISVFGGEGDYDLKVVYISDKLIHQLAHNHSKIQTEHTKGLISTSIPLSELDVFYKTVSKISDKSIEKKASLFEISYILSFFGNDQQVIDILSSCKTETTACSVIQIMESDLSFNWKVGDISERLFITESCLRKKLQKENLSFRKISLDIKMKHAAIMLRRTNKHITQISRTLGFNSTSYFIKVFKKYYSTTPKKYISIYRN
ncbi:helix-turn-helix transcriptional regulator [Escherichia coli]|uniref:AraC family transcriptional regulator n=1 Tax=Escherichia coli TaxID=562 RepID=UPI003C747B8A